jgi:hypothetical protein
MAFLANCGLFFVVYLPLTFLIGWLFGWYVGPTQGPDDSYPVLLWIVVVWPLLLPSFLWVPPAHIVLRIARRRLEGAQLRRLAVAVLALGILAVHLLVWGTAVLSLPALVLTLVAGGLYGLVFRIPRRKALV